MDEDLTTTLGSDDAPSAAPDPPDDPSSTAPPPATDGERTARRLVSFVVVTACCLYVWFVVHGPTLVMSDSTPTGGDMGAHVWGPAYLRDHLLPQLRLTGWTQDWYAGFPAYTFYMVVPSLAIVALDVGIVPANGIVALIVASAIGAAALWWYRSRDVSFRRVVTVTMLAAFAAVLLLDFPYNVGFKLVAVSGIVAFPAGVWYLLSGLSLRQPGPEIGAVASLAFLMDKSLFHIYGGNIASTMAGEFAFSISLTLSLFALGAIARGVGDGRRRASAAVLIGLAMLCHVIPGLFFLAVGAILILVLRPTKRAVTWALPVGTVGALLAMWWYLPFYGRSAYLNDMGWEKLGIVTCNGTQQLSWHEVWRALVPFAEGHRYVTCPVPGIADVAPQTFADPNMLHGKFFFVAAAVGALLSLVMAVRAGIWLSLLTAVAAVAFVVMPQHRFWNARVLPFYYLGIYLLAAVGITLLLRALVLVVVGRWSTPGPGVSAAASGVAWVAVLVMLGMTLRFLPGGELVTRADGTQAYRWMGIESTYQGVVNGWARWNFEGLEAKPGTSVGPDGETFVDRKDSEEFFAMIEEMDRVGREVGCGRAYWEYDGDLNKYGTPMAPMLLPYFTDGCIGSMEGLYFEASSTTPFHFIVQSELSKAPSRPQRFPMVGVEPEDAPEGFPGSWPYRNFDVDQGVRHLQLLGVRYFMTYTPETRAAAEGDDRLELVGESGPWAAFEVAGVDLVEPLEHLPNRWTDVEHNIHSWARPAVEWFDDPDRWDVVHSTDGPDSWPSGSWQDPAVRRAAPAADLEVTEVRTTEDSISFEVSEVGSPVLIRTSYFPNWQVEGAEGPYRVTPNQMVVVPTSERVTLTYGRSTLEWLSWLVSLVGVVGLVALLRWRWPPVEGPVPEWFGDRDGPRRRDDDGDGDGGHDDVDPDGADDPEGGAEAEVEGDHELVVATAAPGDPAAFAPIER